MAALSARGCPAARLQLARPALSRPASRGPVSRRLAARCQATNGSDTSSSPSNIEFLAKLLGTSVVGGGLIKYGSLAIDLPFEPSAAVALSFIIVPCLVCAAYLNSLSLRT